MTKNPFLNALSGLAYICLVSSLLFFGPHASQPKDTILIPIAMLSLFSLSAAMMGLLFFYQPILLFLEGHRADATKLVLQTIGSFAGITVLLLCLILLSGSL